MARGVAARRFGAAARGVRRSPAAAGACRVRSMGRLGRARLSLLLLRRRCPGGGPGTCRQSQSARTGAQSRPRLLGGVRYRSPASRRNLERAGPFRQRIGARVEPPARQEDARRPDAGARASWQRVGRQRHLSGLAARRAAVLLRSTRTGANARGSGARSYSGADGPVRGDPAAARRRQPRVLGRRDGGCRVDNRARRHDRRRAGADGRAPFQDCRVRRAAGRRAWQQGRRQRLRAVAGHRAGGRRHAGAVLGRRQ